MASSAVRRLRTVIGVLAVVVLVATGVVWIAHVTAAHTAVADEVRTLNPAAAAPDPLPQSSSAAPVASGTREPSMGSERSGTPAPGRSNPGPSGSPPAAGTASATGEPRRGPATTSGQRSPERPNDAAGIGIAPEIPVRLTVPSLGIDAGIAPVDTPPIPGRTNAMGGPVYQRIDFPVDDNARYWVRGGLPNTVTTPTVDKEALRPIIYGHASDIGAHLLFQDLAELAPGQTFTLTTSAHSFTYTVYRTSRPAKDGLADDAEVYGYPAGDRKEAALVSCLPDTDSHAVAVGYLTAVTPVTG